MADIEKSEPQTNGLENGLDEDERTKLRPADIDADVKEMERRKRVEMIMSSKLFREELERIIELQLKDGNGPAGLLQQISDMMGIQSGKLHTTHMFRGSNCVTPINDIRGVESMGYEKGEKNLRCKLASVFRLMDLYGWSQGINNQITARLNQDEEHFLVNPHGMLFNEITASSLVKVDMQGNVVESGTTNFSVNTQGFLLHSAIHASRPDVNCVIHIKTPSVLAVSSLKCGLLPVCQEALVIGEVSQHPFVSGIFEPEEREKIIRNLGPHNKVLLLHNHGAVCCGATVEEAFYNVYNTVLACETQMKLMPMGVENLLLVNDETRKQVYDAAHRGPDSTNAGDKKKQFRVGEMEFEALIRMLDNAGFRTGYIYRHPLVKGELPKPKNDVEVPPAVSSLGYLIEQEELYKQGNWKKYVDGKNRLDRTKWLNSPNVYQKVEILETGTSDPKKITKWVDQNSEEWVAESSPTHSSTPVKIDSALQFVPKGTNPKEFKKLQQQIKENRRADKITSGPQSHILEGVSWEEAKKLQDANITQTGDQVILVGAASKGIIQRNYQHNALVYKTPYAKNPFDSMSDKEIEDYKQLVERKQRGDTDYEESQSESEAISSSRQDALRHFKSPLLSPQSATSETEEESRDEPRVLRIETKTAPRPIQAEVVLSDADSDTTDARVERSHSARYPKAEKPESVTLMNSFRKSWSLKREKDKSKDVETNSRNFEVCEYEQDRMEIPQCCVARIKQLTHKPIVVNLGSKTLRPLLKSASDPSNLSILETKAEQENCPADLSKEANHSLSCSSIVNMSDLHYRLNMRKKLLHSAKMKFLDYHKPAEEDLKNKASSSPICALISEIRETISEIMSPERDTFQGGYSDTFRWIERPKFVPIDEDKPEITGEVPLSKSFTNLMVEQESRNEQTVESDLENDKSDVNCSCAIHRNALETLGNEDDLKLKLIVDESRNEKPPENVVTEIVRYVNASEDEATYTITDDSLLQTYSFTESTETEWYYNKTIMTLDNSQTVLEIKEMENKEIENAEMPVKYIDTGIDTEFSSEKEIEIKPDEEQKEEELEMTVDLGNTQACDIALNKSSETDSSYLKSSSGGQTSNDIDTSVAFKTETESSEKSPGKAKGLNESIPEKKTFLEEMLQKTKEPIEEESSGAENYQKSAAEESPISEENMEEREKETKVLESPEFTNIDTEDAPVTSSSKDTSPEIANSTMILTEDEPFVSGKSEGDKKNEKHEHKRKKNAKSSTEITVKKEMIDKNSAEAKVSEIKLTINNSHNCKTQKFEVNIQEVSNTSAESSSSAEETFENFEIVEGSCDCNAQRNLEELQSEVTTTIGKLQTIETFFEKEIKKHSESPEKKRNSSEELAINYNYQEFEDLLNESSGKELENSGVNFNDEVNFVFSVGSQKITENNEMKDFAVSSAFIAAMLTEAVLEKVIPEKLELDATVKTPVDLKDENVTVSLFVDFVDREIECNTEELNPSQNKSIVENSPPPDFNENIDSLPGKDEEQLELQNEPEATFETPECDAPERESLNAAGNDELLNIQNDPKINNENIYQELQSYELQSMNGHFKIQNENLNPAVKNEKISAVEPEIVMLHPQSNNLESETVILNLDSVIIEPETVSVEQKPLDLNPEAVMFYPETMNYGSETAVLNSEPLVIESETATVDSEFVIAKPETGVINSSSLIVEPSLGNVNSGSLDLNPEAIAFFPEPINYELETEILTSEPFVIETETVVVNSELPLVKSETGQEEELKNDLEQVVDLGTENTTDCVDKKNTAVLEIETEKEQKGEKDIKEDDKNEDQISADKDVEVITKYETGVTETVQFLFSCSLKAVTLEPHTTEELISVRKSYENVESVEYIISCILNSVIKEDDGKLPSVNDVINFIVTSEESPADSLAEFEDYENMISTSNPISLENQLDLESLPDDDEALPTSRKKKKGDSIFKVTIATPTKKEIYTNYSSDFSCSFNISKEFDGALCNSYIKTDDVIEDLENLSSDNADFFSIGSPEKNSLNSSFCSADGHMISEQCPCLDFDDGAKSPRSLGIIVEVDEGDSSAASAPE